MIVLKTAVELINGVKRLTKDIKYSNGVITKRVYDEKGNHIDSIFLVKVPSLKNTKIIDLHESCDFDMDRFSKFKRGL